MDMLGAYLTFKCALKGNSVMINKSRLIGKGIVSIQRSRQALFLVIYVNLLKIDAL